jgi:hypothetical protein
MPRQTNKNATRVHLNKLLKKKINKLIFIKKIKIKIRIQKKKKKTKKQGVAQPPPMA